MAMIKLPKNDPTMPFGKHRGERVRNLPDGYIAWLYDKVLDTLTNDSLKEAIEEQFEDRGLSGYYDDDSSHMQGSW